MLSCRMRIDIDDEGTWPTALLEQLKQNFEYHRVHYVAQSKELEKGPAPPIFEDRHRRAAYSLTSLLSGHTLACYHATRLLPEERKWLTAEGLLPLSRELLIRKLTLAMSQGLVSQEDGERLKEIKLGHREGISFALLGSKSMRMPGFDYLFAHWGGEALSYKHRRPSIDGEDIGTPCIVEVDVSPELVDEVGEILVKAYLARRGATSPRMSSILLKQVCPFTASRHTMTLGSESYRIGFQADRSPRAAHRFRSVAMDRFVGTEYSKNASPQIAAIHATDHL